MLVPALEMAAAGTYSFKSFRSHYPCAYFKKTRFPECDVYVDAFKSAVLKYAKPGDVIVLATHVQYSGTWEDINVSVEGFAKELAQVNVSVLLLGAGVVFDHPGVECVPTALQPDAWKKCQVPLWKAKHKNNGYNEVGRGLAKRLPGVFFFDYMPLLCSDKMCGAFIPGSNTLLNWDGGHITVAGSKYLWPWFCTVLRYISQDGASSEPVVI